VADFIEAVDKNRDGFIDYREYMDVLGPIHGQSDSDDVMEGNGSSKTKRSSSTTRRPTTQANIPKSS